ncbi:Vir protein [Bacteroides thetaiotaomicron]|uniref:Vir protein n=1 Tax=Bacteroides thetaiotaomicron TaxID=818 RepID=UPI0039C04786
MSTKEQSATLLRLNKQEQVKALQAVGFADITENSRASEFPNRIKWAAGLLDMRVACNRISDNSKWYFTREEWNSLTPANKLKFIRRGLCIRAHSQSFVIAAQECYAGDLSSSFYWGGLGKTIDGLSAKMLGKMYTCFTGKEDTHLILDALKGTNSNGVEGAPAVEAAVAYKAFTLDGDGLEDDTEWFLPSSGQMMIMYRYRDQINEMLRAFWSSDSMLLTDKYYWTSTYYDTTNAWTCNLNTGHMTVQNKNTSLLHVRATAED